jgi:hypothetical protein
MTDNKKLKEDLCELHCLLQKALMLELSTIPAYATACYSIQEQGQYDRSDPQIANAEPIEVIRQVMVEEMLHMVLAANVLNAIGGSPVMNDPKQLPTYPHELLDGKGPTVRLRRFIPDQVKAFREVERAPENLKEALKGDYHTIGGFYAYIRKRLEEAYKRHGKEKIFTGDAERQIGQDDYYGAGGEVIVVDNLVSAVHALVEIMEEGEGAHLGGEANDHDRIPGPEERWDVAHFYKFDEILHSRYYQPKDKLGSPPSGGDMIVDWSAVWPMRDDPPGKKGYGKFPEIQTLSDRFNATYSELLGGLHAAFNGDEGQLATLVPVMYRLKENAQRLMRVPLPDSTSGETAGPTWEYRSS